MKHDLLVTGFRIWYFYSVTEGIMFLSYEQSLPFNLQGVQIDLNDELENYANSKLRTMCTSVSQYSVSDAVQDYGTILFRVVDSWIHHQLFLCRK
jgi:hypothetical protein